MILFPPGGFDKHRGTAVGQQLCMSWETEMQDIGLHFCSSGSRMKMGIPGPRGAYWGAGWDQRRQEGQKEPGSKFGLYFGGEAEGTKLREDFPLSRPSDTLHA